MSWLTMTSFFISRNNYARSNANECGWIRSAWTNNVLSDNSSFLINRRVTHLAVIGKRQSDSAREVLRLRSAIRLLS